MYSTMTMMKGSIDTYNFVKFSGDQTMLKSTKFRLPQYKAQ